ncbi:hypothetical protein LTR05_001291 [Lithohypha guttulata]|uniref:Hydroxynaphthalene reductase-like protein Arp2 n=1 Tax=Lithohypha guttulata TaxID=1690604 RepID=A0AAN7YL97_9EURO|nr:hypothetical protein LTR05_001291 [Lithohypha guttulata]
MTRFDPNHESLAFGTLKGSVVVLTGGASGIGAATVKQLHARGARIIFGDLDDTRAQHVVSSTSADTVHFLKTDVRNYKDNLALFKLAMSKYDRVDHAIANAGLVEQRGWFDPRPGIEGVEIEPSTLVLDINLKAVLHFAHIACAYLAHGNEGVRRDKSLTLLSSIAGWKETPGMPVYQSSKHGVLGLLRSLRLYVPKAYPGVRVNAICPSFTETRMVAGIRDGWHAAGLPVNGPEDVARVIVAVCAASSGNRAIRYDSKQAPNVKDRPSAGGMAWDEYESQGLNGRSLHVMGAQCYDFEEGLDRTEADWLGIEMSGWVKKGQAGLGDGTGWVMGS